MNANNILNRLYTSDLIPEDGDEISHPNVFSVGNIQSPTLGQIRKVRERNFVRNSR